MEGSFEPVRLDLHERAQMGRFPFKTGPCLVAGEINATTRRAAEWDVCPQASLGCEYSRDSNNFNAVCSRDYSACLVRSLGARK